MEEDEKPEPYVPDHMRPGALMSVLGFIVMVVGICVCAIAFMTDTSVAAPFPASGVDLDRVHNTGLMQRQLMVLLVGLTISFSGLAMMLAGSIKSAIRSRGLS